MEQNKKAPYLPYFIRPCFWQALYNWKIAEWMSGYEFKYAWWRLRTRLIIKGEI